MRISRKFAVTAGVVAVVGAGGIGVAAASGDPDAAEGPDVPISGAALEQASEAALAETGGGQVTGTEVGDEEGYYEVEVTLDDGVEVDVHLDEAFAVIGSTTDRNG